MMGTRPRSKLARPLEVLKAASSPVRYRILLALSQGPATWTHIAHLALGQEPWPISGKLAYHVRELLRAGLIAKNNGHYELTALGQAILNFVAELERWDGHGSLSATEAQGEN